MYKRYKISVIMPCRNEGNHLKKVVQRIPDFIDEIIIVSNKSTDNTVTVAKALGLRVYEDNRTIKGIGYGYAHITGIQKATGDIIIGIDGDATYPIESVSSILDEFIKRKYDFLSCSRYPVKKGTNIPLKLQIGVGILNLETRLLYGKKINDILSGMWVFKNNIRDNLDLTEGDWNLSPQIKLNAAVNPKIKFGEHHIMQHRREGETKQNYIQTGLSHFFWLLRNRVR